MPSPVSERIRTRVGSGGLAWAVAVVALSLAMLVGMGVLALVQPVAPGAPPPSAGRELARVSGMLALALLGAASLAGLMRRIGLPGELGRWLGSGRTHGGLGVLSVVFTLLHLAGTLAAPELGVGWPQLLVPGTRAGGPLAQACGVAACDLLVAVVITGGLRQVLPWRWWRGVHHTSLPLLGLACLHGVLVEVPAGSARVVMLGALALVLLAALLVLVRLGGPARAPGSVERPITVPDAAPNVVSVALGGSFASEFPLRPAPAYLFVAGGIGITAILPMARQVVGTGRPWRMVYLGRSRETMAFIEEAAALGLG